MAAAPKKGATPDDIMAAGAMKPLLMLSKREPVNAAMGITPDKLGVLLLHKKMKPRKVLAELRSEAKKVQLGLESATLRFGTAEVDTEVDPALVLFRINKEPPGMLGAKLKEHLKKAGFAKVEFVVDPSLEDEDAEPGVAAIPAEAAPDWPGLLTELMGLAKGIPAAAAGNAARQAALLQLATVANGQLKTRQDHAGTQAAIGALRAALAGGAQPGGPRPTAALPIWQQAKDAVDDQLRDLAGQLRKTGIPALATVSDDVERLLEEVRVTMVTALMDHDSNPAKPEMRAKALSAVQAAMAWLATDPRIREVDANPFGVQVTAQATLGAALRRLTDTVGGRIGVAA